MCFGVEFSWDNIFVMFCELTTMKTGATLDRAACEESVTLPRQRRADGWDNQGKCICIYRRVIIFCIISPTDEHVKRGVITSFAFAVRFS